MESGESLAWPFAVSCGLAARPLEGEHPIVLIEHREGLGEVAVGLAPLFVGVDAVILEEWAYV